MKRVLENKLEQVAEEKLNRIKAKQSTQQTSEEDRNNYVAQIQHFIRHKQTQQETFVQTNAKILNLKEDNQTLAEQLEKAKKQVEQLIRQIGQYEAKAARELKLEKIAKEAGTTKP